MCFFTFCTRDCGCSAHPAFPAPSVWANESCTTRAHSRRENAETCSSSLRKQGPITTSVSWSKICRATVPKPRPRSRDERIALTRGPCSRAQLRTRQGRHRCHCARGEIRRCLKTCVSAISSRPILRDARLQRAPQDEVVISGANSDPHGEEAHGAVSNHVARLQCPIQGDCITSARNQELKLISCRSIILQRTSPTCNIVNSAAAA